MRKQDCRVFIYHRIDNKLRDWDTGTPLDNQKYTGPVYVYMSCGNRAIFQYTRGESGQLLSVD